MKQKTPPYEAFAHRLFLALKRYELETGTELDQKALANLLGYSGGTVSNWFTGKIMPKVDQLQAIAKALNASAAHLAFGDADEVIMPDNGERKASPSPRKQDHR